MNPPPLFCLHCGYDLRGQTESRCPECGLAFDPVDLCQIIYPDVQPIGRLELVVKLLIQSILATYAALVLGVLGTVYLSGPIPVLLSALLLLVYLYQKADSLVPRILANGNLNRLDLRNRKRFLFLLRWGTPLLMFFQIAVVIATIILSSKFFVPDLMS